MKILKISTYVISQCILALLAVIISYYVTSIIVSKCSFFYDAANDSTNENTKHFTHIFLASFFPYIIWAILCLVLFFGCHGLRLLAKSKWGNNNFQKHDYQTVRNFIHQLAEKRALAELLAQGFDSNTARFLVESNSRPMLNAHIQVIKDYDTFTDIVESSNDEMLQSFLARYPEFRDLL